MSMEVETNIDVKKAVRTSLDYIRELYENQEQLQDLRLEEVELVEDDGKEPFWLVTLSFERPASEPTNAFTQLVVGPGPKFYRVYKTFHIDAKSGKVKAMKIRKT